jgi:hypothetical protein
MCAVKAQEALPLPISPATATLADRIARLESALAHYRRKESEPYLAYGDADIRNPWSGLRRATERVLAKLYAQVEEVP